jgi:enamine deaminase RidA (YjgF/YER057c/UK114 family)
VWRVIIERFAGREIGAAHRELFSEIRPVATMVQVSALADVGHLVEVEVEAYLQDSRP